MSHTMPAFPLGMACFPGETQNLHIFEERYRTLIDHCVERDIGFLIVPILNGKMLGIGTEMILRTIDKKYDDGTSDISVQATKVYEVTDLSANLDDNPYPGAVCLEYAWDQDDGDIFKSQQITSLIAELYELLGIENVTISDPDLFKISAIVHKVGLSLEQEVQILKLQSEKSRQDFLLQHLRNFLPQVQASEQLKIKAAMNGHFKNLNSPDIFG